MGGGLRFEECVFVDDIEINCEAARALGMSAVRFQDNEQAIAELEASLGRTAH
jgi:FMN phosphatase YigB (HAD superfamily)